MTTFKDLPYLLKLLDDEQPEVRRIITEKLSGYGGDLSNQIAGLGIDLSPADQCRLSELLRPERRCALRESWQIPEDGLQGPYADWETFENLLRLISDYLHDGVNLRPPLPDALDLLARDVEDSYVAPTEDDLRIYLFESGLFQGNSENYYSIHNSDLTWVLENQIGNPLGLATVFILLGQRLGLDIQACNYPGHFLALIPVKGEEYLVDCFNSGRLVNLDQFLHDNEISTEARQAAQYPCPPGLLLKRTLANLAHSFARINREEDEMLALELGSMLEGRSLHSRK